MRIEDPVHSPALDTDASAASASCWRRGPAGNPPGLSCSMLGSPARLWRCAMSSDRSVAPRDEVCLLPIVADAEAAILALNNEHATELSWLDAGRLTSLLEDAFYARRIGDADAFLIAFDERATYDSPNYLWFRRRYPRFVY